MPRPALRGIAAFAVGDGDGDGLLDRVDVNHSASGPTTLTVSLGDGTGGFGSPQIAVADVGATYAPTTSIWWTWAATATSTS